MEEFDEIEGEHWHIMGINGAFVVLPDLGGEVDTLPPRTEQQISSF
jgi:hypothetical protein